MCNVCVARSLPVCVNGPSVPDGQSLLICKFLNTAVGLEASEDLDLLNPAPRASQWLITFQPILQFAARLMAWHAFHSHSPAPGPLMTSLSAAWSLGSVTVNPSPAPASPCQWLTSIPNRSLCQRCCIYLFLSSNHSLLDFCSCYSPIWYTFSSFFFCPNPVHLSMNSWNTSTSAWPSLSVSDSYLFSLENFESHTVSFLCRWPYIITLILLYSQHLINIFWMNFLLRAPTSAQTPNTGSSQKAEKRKKRKNIFIRPIVCHSLFKSTGFLGKF